jgi:hypothetical protein
MEMETLLTHLALGSWDKKSCVRERSYASITDFSRTCRATESVRFLSNVGKVSTIWDCRFDFYKTQGTICKTVSGCIQLH